MMADLTTLSLGAGLQSSVMIEMVVEGEFCKPDLVLFADTGDEPPYVYDQVDYLNTRLKTIGLEVETVQQSDMVDDIYGSRRFAALPLHTLVRTSVSGFGKETTTFKKGRLKRQCTNEYKIRPIERRIRQELLHLGMAKLSSDNRIFVDKGTIVESWLGITVDEAERMKPSRTKFIQLVYPLIDLGITREDCATWLYEHSLPIPKKSSCIRCPYHHDSYFADMKTNYPDLFSKVVAFDHDLRDGTLRLGVTAKGEVFIHASCTPLNEVDFSKHVSSPQAAFDFCDEGYCWT